MGLIEQLAAARLERLWELGIKWRVCPSLPLQDGIQAVRSLIPRCWFDKERCAKGLEALRQYRRHDDAKREEYHAAPVHDWTSHHADAFRYFAVGYRPVDPRHHRKLRYDNRWVA